jgi:hypothetical protein
MPSSNGPLSYKDFERGHVEAGGQKDIGYWWRCEAADRANNLVAAGEQIREQDQLRLQWAARHAKLYGNFDLATTSFRTQTHYLAWTENKITLNVVASAIDTLAAKISKNRPAPRFLTSGGEFTARQSAKRLEKGISGIFYESDIYQIARDVFLDACVWDAGVLHCCVEGGKVVYERVPCTELFVDPVDGRYGRPRQLLRTKLVPREVLIARYGKDEEKLQAIVAAKNPNDANWRGFGDCVEVWEGWHLPSGEGAKDGWHVIAIEGCELFAKPWKRQRFPFAFLRFAKRREGFWGQGLAERLSGIQVEINRLLRSVSEQLRRKGRGRIFVQEGSQVVPAHMTNNIADIIKYLGQPPIVDSSNAVAVEEFQQIDRLYEKAFMESGVSQLSAQSKKPSGLDAAVALREFNDIESERFSLLGQDWERLFLEAADMALDELEGGALKNYKVRSVGRRSIDIVDLKDLDVSRDAFVMKMWPSSTLPATPAARLQRVQEYLQSGFIGKEEAIRLLDLPDIEAETQLSYAALDDVDYTIDAILTRETPEIIPPDAHTNLPLLVQRATAQYLRAKHQEGIPPERLDMLLDLIDMATAAAEAQMAPPPGAAPPGAPPGAPMDPMAGLPTPADPGAGPAPTPAVSPVVGL